MSNYNFKNYHNNPEFQMTAHQSSSSMHHLKKPFKKPVPNHPDEYFDDTTFHIFLCSKYEDGDLEQWVKVFDSFMMFLNHPKFQKFGRKINIYHVNSQKNSLMNLLFQLHPYDSFPDNVEFNSIDIEDGDDPYNIEKGEMNILKDFIEIKQTPGNLCIVISFFTSRDPCDAFNYMINIRTFCVENKIRFYQRLPTDIFHIKDLDAATVPPFYKSNKRSFSSMNPKRQRSDQPHDFQPEFDHHHHSHSLSPPAQYDHQPPSNRFRHASDNHFNDVKRDDQQPARELPPHLLEKLSDEDLRTLGYESYIKKRQSAPETDVRCTYYPDGSLFQIITTITFPN